MAEPTLREKYRRMRAADPAHAQFVASESFVEESRFDNSVMPDWDGYADETTRNQKRGASRSRADWRQGPYLGWLLIGLCIAAGVGCLAVAYL